MVEFIQPLQQVGLCLVTPQPTSTGFWTIYMDRLDVTPLMNSPVPSEMSSHSVNMSSGDFSRQNYQNQDGGSMMGQPPQGQQQPEIQTIQLTKSSNGMGLSIVAAKGIGEDKLGIYIKAVVEGGAAFYDGRLQAGDQLLKVDGQRLVGITQEQAAEIMMRTGQVGTNWLYYFFKNPNVTQCTCRSSNSRWRNRAPSTTVSPPSSPNRRP